MNPLAEIVDDLLKNFDKPKVKKWCFFHDWEVVEEYKSTHFRSRFELSGITAEKKICLKCGKIVDKIPELKERDRKQVIYEEARKKRAQELLN